MKITASHLIPSVLLYALLSTSAQSSDVPPPNMDNDVYFGDVHVHTGWSFDAFTNGSKTTPSDAYAWAQGKVITGSGGPEMQLKTPLDFYMVAEHAEYMGVFNQMENPDSPLSKTELARKAAVSPITIARIEKGMPCRLETQRKIILALGFDLSDKDKIFGVTIHPEKGKYIEMGKQALNTRECL